MIEFGEDLAVSESAVVKKREFLSLMLVSV
jgi:hypothetical protein